MIYKMTTGFASQQDVLTDMKHGEMSAFATEDSAAMAQDACKLALSLYNRITGK